MKKTLIFDLQRFADGDVVDVDADVQFNSEPSDTDVTDDNSDYDDSDPDTSSDDDQAETPQSNNRKLKYRGQDVEVPESDWDTLMQMGLDYRTKTQELAEQRRDLEPLTKLAEIIGSDPQLEQALAQYIVERETGQPFTPELVADLQFQQKQADLDRQQLQVNYANQLFRFQQTTGIKDEELESVVQIMAQKGLTDPQDAYDLYQYKTQAYMQKKAEPRPRVMSGGGSPPSTASKTPKTWDAAKAAATDYLRRTNRQNNY